MGRSTATTISENAHHLIKFAALGAAGTLGYQFLKSSSPLVANVAKQTLRTVSTPLATGFVSAAGTLAMYSASSTIANKGYPFKSSSHESDVRNRMIVLGSTTFLLTAMLVNPLKRLISDHQHSKLGLLAVSTAATATSFLGLHLTLEENPSGDTCISLYLKDKVSDLSEWITPSKKSSNLSEEQIEQFWSGFDSSSYDYFNELPNHVDQKWRELFGERFDESVAQDLATYLMVIPMDSFEGEKQKYMVLYKLLEKDRSPDQLSQIFKCYPLEVQISIFARYDNLREGDSYSDPLIPSDDPIMKYILSAEQQELDLRSFASQIDDDRFVRNIWSQFQKTSDPVADLIRLINHQSFYGNPTILILESGIDVSSLFNILRAVSERNRHQILCTLPLSLAHILVRDHKVRFSPKEMLNFETAHRYDYHPEETANERRADKYSAWGTEETSFLVGLEPAKTVAMTTAAILGAIALSALVFRNITYRAAPAAMVVVPILTLARYQVRHEKNRRKTFFIIGSLAGSILAGTVVAPTLSSIMLKNRVGYLEAGLHSAGGVLACILGNALIRKKREPRDERVY